MKQIILLLMILLVGCTHSVDDHLGCQEDETDDGICTVAPEGAQNKDMFETIPEVITEDVQYHGETVGFLTTPNEPGNYPGVVMIHEWWGLNDNVKDMAKLLANEGFVVLAVDLYNGEVAVESNSARTLATQARTDTQGSNANLQAAAQYLKNLPNVGKVGSMGWCFGGQQSLNLALSGEQMDATVIYYGHLTTENLDQISWPVLGIFGADDTGIPVDSVNEFEQALIEQGIDNSINIYEGVGHAFANPSGSNYAPDETMDAWMKTVEFLNNNLK